MSILSKIKSIFTFDKAAIKAAAIAEAKAALEAELPEVATTVVSLLAANGITVDPGVVISALETAIGVAERKRGM